MLDFFEWSFSIFFWIISLYILCIVLVYTWIGIYAFGAVNRHKKQNSFTDYNIILSNTNAPMFSIIAPAFNEGVTIEENVRSLLSLYYHNLEIIIVNDGSTDDSLAKLIQAYELEQVSFYIQGTISTKEVKGIYRSKNLAFKKLIVIDKENGGKADALNVGINVAKGETILSIDVDCILEQDAIVKLAKPFLEQTDKKVIACGGVIRLANNCVIENGKVIDVNLPKSIIGRSQALEYIRAFVLSRMAWSRASGLILISGAFGAFDRKTVLSCGGYDTKTVGEDMELVVRMRRYMEETKQPYTVVNIPESLCWTEAPESKEVLKKQRNRWMRGTMETLWKHRKMMFNPKYGRLGMVSLPYWLMFEFLAPLIEFCGYLLFVAYYITGIFDFPLFLTSTGIVVFLCIFFSIFSIFVDLVTYRVYTKQNDFVNLVKTAIIEPFYYHTIITRASVRGFLDFFKKGQQWGSMTRTGFNQEVKAIKNREKIAYYLQSIAGYWTSISITFLVLFFIASFIEYKWYEFNFDLINKEGSLFLLVINNMLFAAECVVASGVFLFLINFIWPKVSKFLIYLSYSLVVITQFTLFLYFTESKNLLGADIFYYSLNEIVYILKASGNLNYQSLIFSIVLILIVCVPLYLAAHKQVRNVRFNVVFSLLIILFTGSLLLAKKAVTYNDNIDFLRTIEQSKWAYFFEQNSNEFIFKHVTNFFESVEDSKGKNEKFPFLKPENDTNFLGTYFNKSEIAPNLVLIIVEGLGNAYSNREGYVGNFTPFIDSLSNHSLHWKNMLSSSGRTFAALPTLTGSLPFGKNGVLEMENIPNHHNLFTIFNKNGFETGFYYGGNASFDGMRKFLDYSNVTNIIDENEFEANYKLLPKGDGTSWGFEDQAVFSKMLANQKSNSKPYFNTLLTLSSHSPFLINNSNKYEIIFDKILKSEKLDKEQKRIALENKKQLLTIVNVDDALRSFIKNYKQRNDFNNTIFVITGDHSMPEIPTINKIDRYHVPFLIYSPLLNRSQRFYNVSSHFDLVPSIVSLYKNNYGLKTPKYVSWVGNGLSDKTTNNTSGYPIMKSKDKMDDYIIGNYHYADGTIWLLDKNLKEGLSKNQELKKVVNKYKTFYKHNLRFSTSQVLLPDSLFNKY